MKQRISILIILLLSFSSLTGCLYPQNLRVENVGPLETHIDVVREAVERFHKETGVYPIFNSTANTPIYEKYVIDFGQLYPNYLGYIPGNAFENGGPYRYVLVDIETNLTVKLLDLRISNTVGNVQKAVDQYKKKTGSLPVKVEQDSREYEIDYKKLKLSPTYVTSPFSGQSLPLIIIDGSVYVDYSVEIGIFLNKGYQFDGEDYRRILIEHSPFIPPKSLPYKLVDDDLYVDLEGKN